MDLIHQSKDTEWLDGLNDKTNDNCLQETLLSSKDKYRLKMKVWKMILQAKSSQKKTAIIILISDEIDFKSKNVTRGKDGKYIVMKRTIHKEITFIIYTCT